MTSEMSAMSGCIIATGRNNSFRLSGKIRMFSGSGFIVMNLEIELERVSLGATFSTKLINSEYLVGPK